MYSYPFQKHLNNVEYFQMMDDKVKKGDKVNWTRPIILSPCHRVMQAGDHHGAN